MDTLSIPLTQGKSALIDAADYGLIAPYRWHAVRVPSRNSERWYAATCVNNKRVYMHRLLMGFPAQKVDHENHDGLDNRRSNNLRLATNSQNSCNQRHMREKQFRGVYASWGNHGWSARVYKDGKSVFWKKGFKTAEDAARAYDEQARIHHGEFAYQNFPNKRGGS